MVEKGVLRDRSEGERENCGREGYIYALSGNMLNIHEYRFSKSCSNHYDIKSTITFDEPPAVARPREQMLLYVNGMQSGYQDCCFIGGWFDYQTESGELVGLVDGSPGYVNLDLRTLPLTRVYIPEADKTVDGWQGSVSQTAVYTFTFPESDVGEFWFTGRGSEGLGYKWHYEFQK